jgi:hypothetical protein
MINWKSTIIVITWINFHDELYWIATTWKTKKTIQIIYNSFVCNFAKRPQPTWHRMKGELVNDKTG